MQWGIMQEDMARSAYEARHGLIVEQVGFIPHPTIAISGASPDGQVGEDGLIVIKCPTTGTHIDTLINSIYVIEATARGDSFGITKPDWIIDEKYRYQMAWQMECTGRKWCDFISYDPRLPAELSYFCKRFVPGPEFMDAIREEVKRFLAELDELEAKVRAYKEAISA